MNAPNIESKRLILRKWEKSDLSAFAKINSNPKVMEFFPSTLTSTESNKLAKKIIKELEEKPYGLWAVELKNICPFIGFIGLHYQDFDTPFAPCIEIAWRLDNKYWHKGYATEGANAVLKYGFEILQMHRIIATCDRCNIGSERVIQKNGLRKEGHFVQELWQKGQWRDTLLYAILESEWFNRRHAKDHISHRIS